MQADKCYINSFMNIFVLKFLNFNYSPEIQTDLQVTSDRYKFSLVDPYFEINKCDKK